MYGIDEQFNAVDQPFIFEISEDQVMEWNGEELTYKAYLSSGQSLPTWLQFHSKMFFGIPDQPQKIEVELEVSDTSNELSVKFNITVLEDPKIQNQI